ncbi:hypothetical protein FA13DRAFT_1732443 [Coprinellus micaceus]|uniref:DUF7704 domain-containing protein n=1 Tax=Coprinellus micaceus TaxID=71717 RepID=A0A4Y7TBQ8_COPMI|nr:hypothetical protein FA13DRAFT_1732443 [Coprinellus micaceus]
MVSTTHSARFPALPGFYEFFFVFYEPLATFSPVFFYFIWPGKYALYDMPQLELLPSTNSLDSRAEMALYQMVNCHFLVVLFVSFVFQAARKNLADNPRAQESVVGAVLFALAIVDVTHLLGMHFAVIPEQNRFSPQAWGSTIWISDSMVLLDFFVRLVWFGGIGRTRYYYGQSDLATKKAAKGE